MAASSSALICTTPRARNAGPKFRRTVRTGPGVECGAEPAQQAKGRRELKRELEEASDQIAPSGPHYDLLGRVAADPARDGGRDDREVPHHRYRVREQEPPVAVQDPEAPGREHQQADSREEHPHQQHRQIAARPLEPRHQEVHQQRSQQDAQSRDYRDHEGEEPRDGPRDPSRRLSIPPRDQASVLRDQRRGEDAFAEEVLEEVGDSERGGDRVGGDGALPEVVGDDALANQPEDPTGENAGRDERGRAASRRGQGENLRNGTCVLTSVCNMKVIAR
jgi:hypothetical protein